jgi:hypothetical protein
MPILLMVVSNIMASIKVTTNEFGPVPDLPASQYELVTAFTVLGEPGRKSNGRRIMMNHATGRPMLVKSKKALNYCSSFMTQVPDEAKVGMGSEKEPLALWAHIYYASNRPDVSSELLMDLLEKAGVVLNDRWIKTQVLYGAIDRLNPRVELRVYRIL